jgi:hypothetical protein
VIALLVWLFIINGGTTGNGNDNVNPSDNGGGGSSSQSEMTPGPSGGWRMLDIA